MNIDHIKKEFPIFDEKIQNNDLVYLDSANSSQKPKVVVIELMNFILNNFQMLEEVFIILQLLLLIYMKIQELLFKNILMLKIKMKLYLQKVQQKH
jgi:hypothetical protein